MDWIGRKQLGSLLVIHEEKEETTGHANLLYLEGPPVQAGGWSGECEVLDLPINTEQEKEGKVYVVPILRANSSSMAHSYCLVD